MNKKAFSLQASLIAIVMVGVLVTATGVIVNGLNEQYNSGLTYDLGDYDKTDAISEQVDIQKTSLSGQNPSPSESSESSLFRAAFGVILNIFEPYRVVFGEGGMIDTATDRFGIPDYIRIALVTVFLIVLIFAVIAIIFRLARKP